MAKIVLFFTLVWAFGCHQNNSPEPNRTDYACGQVVSAQLFDIKGIPINYAKEIDRYYIALEGNASASGRVSVFCDLPKVYKTAGKTIDFDGRFSPVNFRDSLGEDARLRKYFSPTLVEHVAIDKIN